MPNHEELRKRAARFKGLAAKAQAAKKGEEARHYRKLMKRLKRQARAATPKKTEEKAAEAKAEPAKS